tara:strand:- start:77338 stop:77523 length:186 start_codon:yes stop_codon:yes gene_type:complete
MIDAQTLLKMSKPSGSGREEVDSIVPPAKDSHGSSPVDRVGLAIDLIHLANRFGVLAGEVD